MTKVAALLKKLHHHAIDNAETVPKIKRVPFQWLVKVVCVL